MKNNAFYSNALSIEISQAFDNRTNSLWYDVSTNEGNYWDDYIGTGNYSIDGGKFFDLYTLTETPIVPELNENHFSMFFLLLILVVPTVLFIRKRTRN